MLKTQEVAELMKCSSSQAIAHMRAHGFNPTKEHGRLLWRRDDVDTVLDERKRWFAKQQEQNQEQIAKPETADWFHRDDYFDVDDKEEVKDSVSEPCGVSLDVAKIEKNRAAIAARKANSDSIVTRSDIAALAGIANTKGRKSKPARDAAEDERRFREANPLPIRAPRMPKGSTHLWRTSIYKLVVNKDFVFSDDKTREKILHDSDCPFRLSDDMKSWAKNEYYASERRKAYAKDGM